jgi:hypothetical protein
MMKMLQAQVSLGREDSRLERNRYNSNPSLRFMMPTGTKYGMHEQKLLLVIFPWMVFLAIIKLYN